MRISCKICRRLGVSICGREKCALKRKPYPPGVHGQSRKSRRGRGSRSEYGVELREKQKVKFLYGLRETQFRNYVRMALGRKGDAAGDLIHILESRLDNVVYRLGFACSRAMARQLVSHGHILVNARKVSIPSFRLRKDDTISIPEQSLRKEIFRDVDIWLKKYEAPSWLLLDKEKKEGKVLAVPGEGEEEIGFNLNMVVEFYSR